MGLKRATIEFPCGCVVNSTHVVAMCVPHDRELAKRDGEQRDEIAAHHRELLKAIEELR